MRKWLVIDGPVMLAPDAYEVEENFALCEDSHPLRLQNCMRQDLCKLQKCAFFELDEAWGPDFGAPCCAHAWSMGDYGRCELHINIPG